MKEKALFLHSVQIEEEEVQNILKVALHSFDMNTLGPTVYLECYRPYFYIFSGEATSSLEDFFKVEPFPSLRVSLQSSIFRKLNVNFNIVHYFLFGRIISTI